jgi:hypothetical protein
MGKQLLEVLRSYCAEKGYTLDESALAQVAIPVTNPPTTELLVSVCLLSPEESK